MDFIRNNKNKILVIIVIISLIIIMGLTSKERKNITVVEKGVGNLIAPINKISFNIRRKASDFIKVIRNLSTILEENKELKKEIAKLKEENREQENLIGKSEYLKNEAELKESADLNILSAQVISKEPGNWYDRFIIDKGLKDGVYKDATIIQGIESEDGIIKEGMVGRVSDVGDNWAKVISIVDELNKISFKILRTQDGGVLSGSIDNQLEGFLYDRDADVVIGDKLYTSGLGGIFAKDIFIGEVEEIIEIEEELVKKIVVSPAIDFKKIYKVFVILDDLRD